MYNGRSARAVSITARFSLRQYPMVRLPAKHRGVEAIQQAGKSTLCPYQTEHFYSFSNWLSLQQSHPASFIFQEKNIRLEQMEADQNRLRRAATAQQWIGNTEQM